MLMPSRFHSRLQANRGILTRRQSHCRLSFVFACHQVLLPVILATSFNLDNVRLEVFVFKSKGVNFNPRVMFASMSIKTYSY